MHGLSSRATIARIQGLAARIAGAVLSSADAVLLSFYPFYFNNLTQSARHCHSLSPSIVSFPAPVRSGGWNPGAGCQPTCKNDPLSERSIFQAGQHTSEDIGELGRGGGRGLARAAELNGMPGPLHLLELEDAVPLTGAWPDGTLNRAPFPIGPMLPFSGISLRVCPLPDSDHSFVPGRGAAGPVGAVARLPAAKVQPGFPVGVHGLARLIGGRARPPVSSLSQTGRLA